MFNLDIDFYLDFSITELISLVSSILSIIVSLITISCAKEKGVSTTKVERLSVHKFTSKK